MRRDVHLIQPFGHAVLQIDSTSAGVWAFHCHVAWHASAGFFSQMVFQPGQIIRDFTIPEKIGQTCREWDEFTRRVVPDQIDSGL